MHGTGDAATAGRHRRIDDIEVLRAFAIGLVLLQHLPEKLMPWLPAATAPLYQVFGFWSGVDLFFAISGFVIARSLLPTLAQARGRAFLDAALGFWVRRAWRLLPSAWLWGAVIILLTAAFNRSGAFDTLEHNLAGVAAAVLQVENFRVVYTLGRVPFGVTAVYWTLSLEEQFYLALPILMFLARSRLPIVLALVVLAQLFAARTGPHASPLLNAIRSDALALGVLLAIWEGRASYLRLEPRRLARAPWRWLVAPAFLAVFAVVTGPRFGPGGFTIGALALLAAGIVWIASYDRDYVLPPGRLKQALCWMGARSYAIYLVHQPVNHATVEFWWRADARVLQPGFAHAAILLTTALPLTLVLVELNYRCLEVPLRRHGARMAARIGARGRQALAPA